ncbi:hypothetical protein [endosymbiont GvMRE of Glomus versiforme]|uniref:hypothetical protein n=1 Tax=endosymbiont GvMRE of Glomus versiforme TaxID=2039283 RepID=UPI000ED70E55|nr:hypothetical protein [endosymbiont GvMRE of Glomus versiforme]RHZ36729.1 hypothetical protein GvMRE_I2g416 [endosymbiont GvMRE of Glomus versiforme]RHZ37539.1 hypothetical protein GvMRE_I1g715 [endosymbiont GvMRE of Glomus versiforme]
MTKNLSELIGKIISKQPKEVRDKRIPFYGNLYYRLKVLAENEETHIFFVYSNLVNQTLWRAITNSHYADKRYLFRAEKKKNGFILHNWQELKEENA